MSKSQLLPKYSSNIEFVKYTGFYENKKIVQVPYQFSWHDITNEDSKDIKKKKKLIGKPENQYLCGSCWAVAVAGVISDMFVVQELVHWKPDLSATYILTNYPQQQCKGGSTLKALKDVSKQGIASKHCIDYTWCSKNQQCTTRNSSQHFKVDMSPLIPKKGCATNSAHYLYHINPNIKTIAALEDGHIYHVQELMRSLIYKKGPLIGGFILFPNFVLGNFHLVNGGVYLEDIDYTQPVLTFKKISIVNLVGTHAVAIMGWGVQHNMLISDGKHANVPYWICRNSWGTHWGNHGYFKIAMYPFNKYSQFSRIVDITTKKGITRLGGVLTFNVEYPPILTYKLPVNANLTPNKKQLLDESELVQQFKECLNFTIGLVVIAIIFVLFIKMK